MTCPWPCGGDLRDAHMLPLLVDPPYRRVRAPKAGGRAAAPADGVGKRDAGDGEACTRPGVTNEPDVRGTRGNAWATARQP